MEEQREIHFQKAKKLAEQLLLMIKSEFTDQEWSNYSILNTLSLMLINYSIENKLNPEAVVAGLDAQFRSEITRRFYESQEEKSKITSIN